MIKVLILLSVCAFCIAQSPPDKGNANYFVDMLLDSMRKNVDVPLEPYLMPEQRVGFERKIILVTWKGEMKVKNTVINGLTTLHRTDDCTLSFGNGTMIVDATLGMGVLNAKATADLKFMNLGPSIDIAAKVGFADIDLQLLSRTAVPGSKAELTKFALKALRGLEVKITNLGPLKYLINFFSGLVTDLLKRTVKNITEKVMHGIVKKYLQDSNLPIF